MQSGVTAQSKRLDCVESDTRVFCKYARTLQILIVTASILLITLSVNLQVPLYKTYALDAGYGNGLIAVTFAAYVVGLIPVLILLGGISDRIGRKPTILLGLLIAFFANLFIILEPTIQTLLMVRVLQGAAVGLCLGAGTAYLSEIMDDIKHGVNLSGITVTMGLGSGSILTSTSLIYDMQGTTPFSYLGITLAIVLCFLLMLLMPYQKATHANSIVRLPFISRETLDFCTAIFLSWSLTGIIIATIPGELERLNFTGWSGLLVFLAIATGAAFQPAARKMAPANALFYGYVLLVLGYTLLLAGVWFESLTLILAAAACSGASSFGLIYLGGLAAVVQSGESEKARAVSGYFLFAYVGLGLPCIFIGYLAEASGLFPALAIAGGVFAIAAVLFFTLTTPGKTPTTPKHQQAS